MLFPAIGCPPETTIFDGVVLEWPGTPPGVTVPLNCPSSGGTITRECSFLAEWLDPISFCDGKCYHMFIANAIVSE